MEDKEWIELGERVKKAVQQCAKEEELKKYPCDECPYERGIEDGDCVRIAMQDIQKWMEEAERRIGDKEREIRLSSVHRAIEVDVEDVTRLIEKVHKEGNLSLENRLLKMKVEMIENGVRGVLIDDRAFDGGFKIAD